MGAMNALLARTAAWAKANARNGLYALRNALSAGVALIAADALHLAQPTWAVISAIVVSRASSSDAFKSGRNRILGTLAGAILGVLIALGRPLGVPDIALIFVGVGIAAFTAAVYNPFLAAPVALAIVLSTDPSGGSSLTTAIHRLVEVGLGAVIAILFAYGFRAWGRWRARKRNDGSAA
jgi:uncharacterized membrane protein YccC